MGRPNRDVLEEVLNDPSPGQRLGLVIAEVRALRAEVERLRELLSKEQDAARENVAQLRAEVDAQGNDNERIRGEYNRELAKLRNDPRLGQAEEYHRVVECTCRFDRSDHGWKSVTACVLHGIKAGQCKPMWTGADVEALVRDVRAFLAVHYEFCDGPLEDHARAVGEYIAAVEKRVEPFAEVGRG